MRKLPYRLLGPSEIARPANERTDFHLPGGYRSGWIFRLGSGAIAIHAGRPSTS